MQGTRWHNMVKGVVALTLACSSVSVASARSWNVEVKDDLFSDTGKSAALYSGGQAESLLFHCDSNGLEFSYLASAPMQRDERSGLSIPVTLVIKVDDNETIRFNTAWTRRNEHYFHARVWAKDYPQEIPVLLQQIRDAKSKIQMGSMSGDRRHSQSLSVAGSTAATTTFIEVCGLKGEGQ